MLYICLHEVRTELRLKGSEGLHSLKYQGSFAKEPLKIMDFFEKRHGALFHKRPSNVGRLLNVATWRLRERLIQWETNPE